MERSLITKIIQIEGLDQNDCHGELEASLKNMAGVARVKAIWSSGNVYVTYDADETSLHRIIAAVEKLGYGVKNRPAVQNTPEKSGAYGGAVKKLLRIEGMTCTSCEMRIENKLKGIKGVAGVKVSYGSSTASFSYEPDAVALASVIKAIEGLGYGVADPAEAGTENKGQKDKSFVNRLLGAGIIILAAYVVIKNTAGFNFLPQISQGMGYGILFAVGLITSLHCIAMCGGINLSQCVSHNYARAGSSKLSLLKPSLMYNAGRVTAYTVIGGTVGALGSAIGFSGTAKGIVAIVSGLFMVIMGLNMLNIFPWLKRLNPRMPKIFGNKVHGSGGRHGPFYVGLLNGLMPCGPLQAMQMYALGTGSFAAGALSMLVFGLGTVPLMFGFGAVSSFLTGKFTRKMMKASAVLVMILGIVMLNRGLSLSGINVVHAATSGGASGNVAVIEGGAQEIATELEPGGYAPLIVQKGIPVKWNLKAEAGNINGCNETIVIPEYNIQKKLEPGDNIIEFTPGEEGDFLYTCWMGMINGNIKVVADINNVSGEDIARAGSSSDYAGAGGGCCGPVPPGYEDGKVPVDNIQAAQVSEGRQEVTVTVDNRGYTPAVVVLERDVEAKIKFNPEQLNSCNYVVVFPEYRGQLDITQENQKETPWLTPTGDFTFECGMGMLHGYVKVVDDIDQIDPEAIKREIEDYTPASGGGGGCCAPKR